MFQNGLIILTFVSSLMRVVDFIHDYHSMANVMTLTPLIKFPYLSGNILESSPHGILLFTGDIANIKVTLQNY